MLLMGQLVLHSALETDRQKQTPDVLERTFFERADVRVAILSAPTAQIAHPHEFVVFRVRS